MEIHKIMVSSKQLSKRSSSCVIYKVWSLPLSGVRKTLRMCIKRERKCVHKVYVNLQLHPFVVCRGYMQRFRIDIHTHTTQDRPVFGVHPSTLPTVSHDKHQNQFHQSWDLLSTQILYLFIINNKVRNTGCGSVVERVVSQSEGWGFDPRLRWAACQSVLGQDTEPHVGYECA